LVPGSPERHGRRAVLEDHEWSGAMPAWKQLPEAERWQIVNYIRTLKK
jgi:mono/diheme cytochrome c family protein